MFRLAIWTKHTYANMLDALSSLISPSTILHLCDHGNCPHHNVGCAIQRVVRKLTWVLTVTEERQAYGRLCQSSRQGASIVIRLSVMLKNCHGVCLRCHLGVL